MIQFPRQLEKLLLQYIKRTASTRRSPHGEVHWENRDLKHFATGAAELSQRFTSERSQLKGDYFRDPKLRSGYLLYFLPINFTKATDLLRRIPESRWQGDTLSFLDLGSGPATGSLAFLTEAAGRNPKANLRIHLVDRNKRILQDGKQLLESWHAVLKSPAKVTVSTQSGPLLQTRLRQNYDFILLHHVLNEFKGLGSPERAQWLYSLVENHLKPGGILALVEPALKRPGRDLMALRDHLVTTGELQVISPCLHEHPCPMLSGTNGDWCHFYIDWEEPPFMRELDKILGNDNRFLKMSYLLLERSKHSLQRPPHHFRVVSNRMATRGKTEVILCGEPGRINLSRLDRHRSNTNAALDQVKRGQILRWTQWNKPGFTDDGSYRLEEKSEIQIMEKNPD